MKDARENTTPNTTPTTPTEPKTEQDKKLEDKKPEGAPEKYADFKIPEGVTLAPETIAKASEVFKGLGLNQDQAQGLVDFHVNEMKKMLEAPMNAYSEMRTKWKNEVFADATLSANNELRPEVKANIAKVINSMGTQDARAFRDVLDQTGVGDNPSIVRFLNHVAQFVTEGHPVVGKGPSPAGQRQSSAPTSAAQAMYPNLPSANSRS